MEECCDICGDIGVPEALITCCQCKINVEHMYCMRTLLEKHVNDWRCEECEKAKQLSSCQLGDLTGVSKPNSLEGCKGGELRAESRKLPNGSRVGSAEWEKMAPTGKTKYISVKEALMLSSGEKKFFPSSSNTCRSKPSGHKRGIGRLDRATFKPKTSLLNFSSQMHASESLQPPKPQRPGNVEIRVKQLQQSRKLTDELRSASRLRPSEAPKDPQRVVEQPSNVELPVTGLVNQSPVPPMNASPIAISGVEDHNNAIDSEEYSQVPALDALWKGSFTIQDTHVKANANHLVEAHPPSRVHRKIYEFSKKMPEVLHLELVPSRSFWSTLFDEHIPDQRDIALYFFPGMGARSEEEYIQLVESISSTNMALREQIADVELLVFSSKLLPVNCQCCNGKYFLWGVFHRLKQDAIMKLDQTLELSLQQPSDDVNHGQSQVSNPEEVDMDVDMIGGIHVGRMDIRATREPLGLNCTGEEPRAAMALLPEPALQSASVPTAAIPSPTVKTEAIDIIPPGFEELYRLRMQSSSSLVNHVQSRR